MIRPDKDQFSITQGFGVNTAFYGPLGHDGIDIGTPVGTPLYAARSGRVRDVNNSVQYGLRIKIDNGSNVDYVGHLSEALVHIGDQVTEGQLIAKSGATGQVTGPHVHWGVYTYQGKPLNPLIELANNQGEEVMTTLNDDSLKTLAGFLQGFNIEQAFEGKFLNDFRALYGTMDANEAISKMLLASGTWKNALIAFQKGVGQSEAETKLNQVREIVK